MYPKTTFLKKQMESVEQTSFKTRKYRSREMNESHLKLYDAPGCVYRYFEIDMPYLLLYEKFDLQADRAVYLEFSEDSKVYASNSLLSFREQPKLLHSHDFYELTFVLSGCLHMRIENEDLTYGPGECCICNKNIHHVEQIDTDVEIFLILVKEDYIQDVLGSNYYYDNEGGLHTVGNYFQTLITQNRNNPFYDAKTYIDLRLTDDAFLDIFLKLINTMIESISENHSGKSHLMKALFCRFIEMIEDEKMHHPEIHWAKLSTEEQVISNISQAYKDKLGVFSRLEIEKITGYNGDYAERIMKRNTGKTLQQYGKDILLQKTANLLLDTDKSIGNICEEMGYSNRHYFNKIFVKRFGITPSAYRAQKNNLLVR